MGPVLTHRVGWKRVRKSKFSLSTPSRLSPMMKQTLATTA